MPDINQNPELLAKVREIYEKKLTDPTYISNLIETAIVDGIKTWVANNMDTKAMERKFKNELTKLAKAHIDAVINGSTNSGKAPELNAEVIQSIKTRYETRFVEVILEEAKAAADRAAWRTGSQLIQDIVSGKVVAKKDVTAIPTQTVQDVTTVKNA